MPPRCTQPRHLKRRKHHWVTSPSTERSEAQLQLWVETGWLLASLWNPARAFRADLLWETNSPNPMAKLALLDRSYTHFFCFTVQRLPFCVLFPLSLKYWYKLHSWILFLQPKAYLIQGHRWIAGLWMHYKSKRDGVLQANGVYSRCPHVN